MKVFRFGKFYEYDEDLIDKSWTKEQRFQASSLYATCCHLGYDESTSYSLSQMYVYYKSMPGLKYEKKHMDILSRITGE